MDKDRLIGLTLISLILITYMHFWGPTPDLQSSRSSQHLHNPTPTHTPLPAENPARSEDPQHAKKGAAKEIKLANRDVQITLTAAGGQIKEVVLKNYPGPQGNPLVLLDTQSTQMGFCFDQEDAQINTQLLHFDTQDTDQYVTESEVGTVTFQCALGPKQYVLHHFSLPGQGYELAHTWELISPNTPANISHMYFFWHNWLKPSEKDITACRQRSTINYYLANRRFQHLKEGAEHVQEQQVTEPMQWVAIKQRFFTAGVVAENTFAEGCLTLTPTPYSEHVLKEAHVRLGLLSTDDEGTHRKEKLTFYFGPNERAALQGVAPGFEKNLTLGWPVVKSINTYVVLPFFSWLETYIGNYGLIICILAICIKLLLLPLSYKSYLSMAQMKLLKPTLDALRDQYPDDLQKVQREHLKLYREIGINPLSGCLPIFLQMPILLAMFNFFPNVIALRGQAFLWAQDLSTYDSILNLPFHIPLYGSHVSLFTILMTASTMLYTWSSQEMSNQPEPMKTLAYLLPITFLFILNSFPAGLSFYYLISNLITFGQQKLIKQLVDEDKIKRQLDASTQKPHASSVKRSLTNRMRHTRGTKRSHKSP